MTKTVVITDIFGKSPALEKLCTNLQDSSSGDIQIIDPYNGKSIDFSDEKQAYQHFTLSGGVEAYAKVLLEALTTKHLPKKQVPNKQGSNEQVPTRIIAFSVGASALWSVSENNQLIHVTQATCFYGSQIRRYQNITPIFPIQLIFPAHEDHFDVDELEINVARKEKVATMKTTYLHGFMNELSTNFDTNAYKEYLHYIKSS